MARQRGWTVLELLLELHGKPLDARVDVAHCDMTGHVRSGPLMRVQLDETLGGRQAGSSVVTLYGER